jgi:hypothetical protein
MWPPFGNGEADAHNQRAELTKMGAPAHIVRALDVEAAIIDHPGVADYVNRWRWGVAEAGDEPLVYTSAAYASRFAGCALWLADWTNQPHLHAGSVATQYSSPTTHGGNVDQSVMQDQYAARCWPVTPKAQGGHTMDAVAIAVTRSGNGYWIAEPDGTVYAYGDAEHAGDMAGKALNGPIVDVAAAGTGYILLGEDGGVFTFGGAQYHGSGPESEAIAAGADEQAARAQLAEAGHPNFATA